MVKVKHESWQAGIELLVFDLVAVSAEIDMVLVGIFQDVLRLPKNGWKGNGATCVREQNECSVISAEHTNIKQGFLQKSKIFKCIHYWGCSHIMIYSMVYYLLLNYGSNYGTLKKHQPTGFFFRIAAQATAPSPKELELLMPADGGCSSLTKEDCLSSKDASVATKKHFKAEKGAEVARFYRDHDVGIGSPNKDQFYRGLDGVSHPIK